MSERDQQPTAVSSTERTCPRCQNVHYPHCGAWDREARKYSFDPECLKLARYFVGEEVEKACRLAQEIQDVVERFEPEIAISNLIQEGRV